MKSDAEGVFSPYCFFSNIVQVGYWKAEAPIAAASLSAFAVEGAQKGTLQYCQSVAPVPVKHLQVSEGDTSCQQGTWKLFSIYPTGHR